MISKNNQNLIVKYLVNQATSQELDELELLLRDPGNVKEFNSFVKTNYLIEFNLKTFDADKTKKKLHHLIKEDKKVLRLKTIQNYSKYAAILAGIILSIYFFKNGIYEKPVVDNPVIVNSTIEPGTDKATLTLEDGSQIVLEKGESYQTHNASSNGEEIIYEAEKRNKTEVVYNYLTIPRGGQFFIKLSDGTQVWLNSESQLEYPVSFIEGEARKVELVYGEAYFDVSPSSEHGGSKFKVFNQSQEIEVLGTEFNIKAYRDETNIYTTLVEGKVSINSAISNQILKPNQQTNLNLKEKSLTISDVDVYNETSWKEGVFSFQRKPLGDIMKVLSRWYNIDVQFNDVEIKNAGFNGAIGKDQKLEDILETIKNFGVIKNYEIEKQRVILK
ncbi:FecR family protein [Winogradskyella schleiferi]|uniref:FecR family protein n=1 Tax=Winogradskyella schleiferi TaxID=2686078 RepID=UPI0015BB5F75|nr:FecR family protein [Winogradskyella schleiferi]